MLSFFLSFFWLFSPHMAFSLFSSYLLFELWMKEFFFHLFNYQKYFFEKMRKNTSPVARESDTMTHLDFWKKFKRLNPLEPSLGILGFILVAAIFIGCFFYLDYRTVTRRLHYHDPSWLGHAVPFSSSPSSAAAEEPLGLGVNERPGFLDEGAGLCDVFDGNWVWDDNYPLYRSSDCLFLDEGFRCLENGRPDNFYTKWRWQPNACNLPRFVYLLSLYVWFLLVAGKVYESISALYGNVILYMCHIIRTYDYASSWRILLAF